MHKNRFYILGSFSPSGRVRETETPQYGRKAATGKPPVKFISLFSGAMGLDIGQAIGC